MQLTNKKILFSLYILMICCMGAATIIEKYKGSDFVSSAIYGSWWFSLIWAALAATGICHFIRHRTKAVTATMLHASFVVILIGAFITHISAERGQIHLRQGSATDTYTVFDRDNNPTTKPLPFTISLDRFDVKYHSGTDAASDYISEFTITDADGTTKGAVSMNNIFSYGTMRFYQSSYDSDMLGATVSTNSDPVGIPVTYTGYILLFISLILMLFDPRGAYRRLLRSDCLRKSALLAALLLSLTKGYAATATAGGSDATVKAHTLPRDIAMRFGELNMLYNNRICPVQTFAIDFTKKLYGASSYKGLSAEQVLTGWMFWGDEWMNEPLLKIKSGDLKEAMMLPDHVPATQFFKEEMGGYTIGPYIREYYEGNHDGFHAQAIDIDDRIQLLMDVQRNVPVKIFPLTEGGVTKWYAPTDGLPKSLDTAHTQFIRTVLLMLADCAKAGNHAQTSGIIDKLHKYQLKNGGDSLPSPRQTAAERTYNSIPFATILFMVCLTMGVLTFLLTIMRLCRQNGRSGMADAVSYAVMLCAFAALTYCEYLRWTISGTLPMTNGYETMLFVAWIVMLVSLLSGRRFHIMLTCGFLMSGFFLLVSHISQMDPQISHIMPVLNSPLLSIHVSIIMLAFALLSLTFISGITALTVRIFTHNGADPALQALRHLSLLFLYPAIAALGIGIFVGAIWANVSWGQYWGWDPKEVWALITFMVYAAALHPKTLPAMQRPTAFHTFMVLAFLTIIMTYFGVNYFLGGMHSYA